MPVLCCPVAPTVGVTTAAAASADAATANNRRRRDRDECTASSYLPLGGLTGRGPTAAPTAALGVGGGSALGNLYADVAIPDAHESLTRWATSSGNSRSSRFGGRGLWVL